MMYRYRYRVELDGDYVDYEKLQLNHKWASWRVISTWMVPGTEIED